MSIHPDASDEDREAHWNKVVGRDSATSEEAVIDKKRNRYPFCIVWTPLPLITWILPFIGHMGICDSEGKVLDFAGPYFIGVDDMAFGSPTRYLQLDPRKTTKSSWDRGVAKGLCL